MFSGKRYFSGKRIYIEFLFLDPLVPSLVRSLFPCRQLIRLLFYTCDFVIDIDRLVHENLLSFLGYSADESYLCIVYEFMPRGSLEDALACKVRCVFKGFPRPKFRETRKRHLMKRCWFEIGKVNLFAHSLDVLANLKKRISFRGKIVKHSR